MVEIREIKPEEAVAAKKVMFLVCNELWGDTEEQTLQYDPLLDYESLPGSYRDCDGIFLVVLDGSKVVGIGGIKRYQGQTAEVKRMWLLKPYRGRGLGKALMIRLIEFAREKGYEHIWLEVGTPEIQPEAVGLYTSLGFHPIPVYAHMECELAMEKTLSPI